MVGAGDAKHPAEYSKQKAVGYSTGRNIRAFTAEEFGVRLVKIN